MESHIPSVWHQGDLAGLQGLLEDTCPYETNSEEERYWLDGWQHGKKSFREKLKTIELIKV